MGKLTQMRRLAFICLLGGYVGLTTTTGGVAADAGAEIAMATVNPAFITWRPHVNYESLSLRIALPNGGKVFQTEFRQGQPVAFDLAGDFPDGLYTYELVVTPRLDPSIKKALVDSRRTGNTSIVDELQARGVVPRTATTQTGYFTVMNGSIIVPTEEE